jgi:Calcineurin-like phosphoesterase
VSIAASSPAHRGRLRSAVIGLVAGVVTVVAVFAGVAGLQYHDQILRYATHRKGGPTETTAWTPVRAGDQPELHLAVAGDVGDSGARLDATAAGIERMDARQAVDDLLLLGDNAYPVGEPAELRDTVFTPFGPLLAGGTELLAVLGNHDVKQGHAAGQVAALGMPGRWWAHHQDDLLVVGLDSTRVDDPDQLAWLEATLASATERWRIVMLHHPAYSAGYQGSNLAVRRRFAPLFSRYGVQLVLSGHDHDYQRSKPIDGVTYVVSGGAAGTRRTGEDDFTAVSYSWHHFVELAVLPDRLVLRSVSPDLRVADEAVIRP